MEPKGHEASPFGLRKKVRKVSKWKKIMVCIPTINHKMTDGIVKLAHGLAKIDMDPKIDLEFNLQMSTGSSVIAYNVEYQRNIMTRNFLKSDCDALWFVDSDVMPSENSLALLNVEDADIVGGVYPILNNKSVEYGETKSGQNRLPILWSAYSPSEDNDGKPGFLPMPLPPEPNGLICEVAGLGTGCVIIDRSVLADPRMEIGKADPDGTRAVFRTRRTETGKMLWTDDLDFCYRATQLGYKIKCHTDVRWGHMKHSDCIDWWDAMCEAITFGVVIGERQAQGDELASAIDKGLQKVGRKSAA